MFGGIEAGGTKFICGIGDGPENLKVAQFPTTTPDETLSHVLDFFAEHTDHNLQAFGIGSFGPIDRNSQSPNFGRITSTPKKGWQNFDLRGAVKRVFDVPVGFDTDVNAAALAESRWGGGKGLSDLVYMTIGTGIGGGAFVNGQLVHGLVHAEVGHLRIPHDHNEDPFDGCCPFHGDCLEGLASGPAIQARWGKPALELAADHPAWKLEAKYLALGVANLTFTLSPRRVLLGGGVMQQPQLIPLVRGEFMRVLNGYLQHPSLTNNLDQYIVPPRLGSNAGILGAIALAEHTYLASERSI